jgi:hypothetical protein
MISGRGTEFTEVIYGTDEIELPVYNNYRVEQKTDYEKLVLDIETDGSITPQNALTEASKILIYHFMFFALHDSFRYCIELS